jgi:hypothetical protein
MQFNYFDVQYNKEELSAPVASSINNDRFNTRRYPIDLGNVDKGHYVFFTIYQQIRSSSATTSMLAHMLKGQVGNQTATTRQVLSKEGVVNPGTVAGYGEQIVKDAFNTIWSGAQNFLSKPEMMELKKRNEAAFKAVSDTVNSGVDTFKSTTRIESVTGENLFNQVQLIKDAIALYMPDTLAFSSSQNYSDISMSDIGLGLVGVSALNSLKSGGLTKENIAKTIGGNISPFLYAGLKKQLGTSGTSLFTAFTGQVMNPQLELLYTSPSFREFSFDFAFYPRSQKEARDVFDIIELFRFHSAPEIKTGEAGFFLYPPSLFDVEFRYGSTENVNLPKLSSCVLTKVDVDYAPNGFAAYETGSPHERKDTSELGGTGTPVATRMTLHFKETIIQSKHTILYQNQNKPFRTSGDNSVSVTAPIKTTESSAAVSQVESTAELGAVPVAELTIDGRLPPVQIYPPGSI